MDIVKTALFSATLSIFTFSSNAHSNECNTYINTIINPMTFNQAYKSLDSIEPKGEFETTKDYKNRLNQSNIPEQLIIAKKAEKNADDNFIKYDADKRQLSISEFAFHNQNIGIWEAMTSSNPKLNITMLGTNFTVTDLSEVNSSSYIASNSFGAKKRVNTTDYKVSVILDPIPERLYSNLFPKLPEGESTLGAVSATVNEAKLLKQSSYLAFVIKPAIPLKSTAKWSFPVASFDRPFQSNYEGKILVASFKCGLWLDSSNKVIGAYAMN
jgi:hypothetical protein